MMQTPGNTLNHQRPTIRLCLPSDSIKPQAACGGGTPTPRNDKVASVMITTPSIRVPSTTAELITLGRICRSMIAGPRHPTTLAASTYSRSFTLNTAPRVMRT